MKTQPMQRRRFLRSALAGAPLFGIPGLALAQTQTVGPLDRDLVLEFVSVAHTDLPRTKKLLTKEPALARAAWDWGRGDSETGLGGAAHSGSRDIVRYLLANGARMDLFAAAALGELGIVKAVLTALPEALHVPGPHGIPLFEHAKAGGDEAKPVLEYLISLGGMEREIDYKDLPLSAAEQERYVGVYRVKQRPGFSFMVTVENGRLHGKLTRNPQYPLHYQGGGIFYAPDAEATIHFGLEKERASTVKITQFDLTIRASRRGG